MAAQVRPHSLRLCAVGPGTVGQRQRPSGRHGISVKQSTYSFPWPWTPFPAAHIGLLQACSEMFYEFVCLQRRKQQGPKTSLEQQTAFWEVSSAAQRACRECLQSDPARRPSSQQMLAHKWFATVPRLALGMSGGMDSGRSGFLAMARSPPRIAAAQVIDALRNFAFPGKGKLVDILAQDVQLCARFNGGANDAARCDRHRQDRSTWSTLAPSSPLETLASGASSLHSRTVSLRPMLLLVAASPEALLQPSSKLAQLVGVLNLSKALTSPARRRSCPSMALSKTSLFRNPKNIGQASAENSWRKMRSTAFSEIVATCVVVHVPTLMKELQELKEFDPRALERVFISTRAHILFDSHQERKEAFASS
ncbi:unnamed protein product [Symbiodinium natans]|uniref:Uncharacterized protein n=1 Tax=Symbiodinium natans TaxID=878477 RepID=A0A812JB88_9DINO|nr:unnamed protein product [Symbiodinium natans]